jgi:hypothetical protein
MSAKLIKANETFPDSYFNKPKLKYFEKSQEALKQERLDRIIRNKKFVNRLKSVYYSIKNTINELSYNIREKISNFIFPEGKDLF